MRNVPKRCILSISYPFNFTDESSKAAPNPSTKPYPCAKRICRFIGTCVAKSHLVGHWQTTFAEDECMVHILFQSSCLFCKSNAAASPSRWLYEFKSTRSTCHVLSSGAKQTVAFRARTTIGWLKRTNRHLTCCSYRQATQKVTCWIRPSLTSRG